jgi:hypothetical protein
VDSCALSAGVVSAGVFSGAGAGLSAGVLELPQAASDTTIAEAKISDNVFFFI